MLKIIGSHATLQFSTVYHEIFFFLKRCPQFSALTWCYCPFNSFIKSRSLNLQKMLTFTANLWHRYLFQWWLKEIPKLNHWINGKFYTTASFVAMLLGLSCYLEQSHNIGFYCFNIFTISWPEWFKISQMGLWAVGVSHNDSTSILGGWFTLNESERESNIAKNGCQCLLWCCSHQIWKKMWLLFSNGIRMWLDPECLVLHFNANFSIRYYK